MSCCQSPQCRGIEEVFDTKLAENELEKYRRGGPWKETRRLLEAVRAQKIELRSLLDIGGGVGAIQHELAGELDAIVNVDASPAYSQTARSEAERRGYAGRAQYHVGDFVRLSENLPVADLVTLDRVICCYDDMPALVDAAVRKAGRIIGLVYPVDRLIFRAGIAVINFFQRILRRPFRMFIHDSARVDARIREAGFQPRFARKGLFWQVTVYAK
ncbi:MAG TPA: methyltransferase [Anaerolineales bacterium]|nr:methyltransferase [Anaerolineales bacterium]